MFKFSHIIAGLGLLTLSTTTSIAQTTPPARTYWKDDNGNETRTVHERWTEDANGQKNGKYLEYDKEGNVLKNIIYVHGKKDGLATECMYKSGFGLTRKKAGKYANDHEVGVWVATVHSGDISNKYYYDADGKQLKTENYYNGKLIPSPY
jgi:antitoxin component YwqK of YwqJK toxin-antitoxin module